MNHALLCSSILITQLFFSRSSSRYSDTNNIVYKQLGPVVKAYENWRESETLERLESIKDNSNAIHMESLVIRERILGIDMRVFFLSIFCSILIDHHQKLFHS